MASTSSARSLAQLGGGTAGRVPPLAPDICDSFGDGQFNFEVVGRVGLGQSAVRDQRGDGVDHGVIGKFEAINAQPVALALAKAALATSGERGKFLSRKLSGFFRSILRAIFSVDRTKFSVRNLEPFWAPILQAVFPPDLSQVLRSATW